VRLKDKVTYCTIGNYT